jgi:hypothetical protein
MCEKPNPGSNFKFPFRCASPAPSLFWRITHSAFEKRATSPRLFYRSQQATSDKRQASSKEFEPAPKHQNQPTIVNHKPQPTIVNHKPQPTIVNHKPQPTIVNHNPQTTSAENLTPRIRMTPRISTTPRVRTIWGIRICVGCCRLQLSKISAEFSDPDIRHRAYSTYI